MPAKSNSGRGSNGRFQPGNPGGPGRPSRQTEYQYLRAISEICPVDTFKEIVTAAVDAACRGDDKARIWLSSYLVGHADSKAVCLSQIDMAESQLARDEEFDRFLNP
ncbi:MAG: hypothetical protein PHO83_14825 [Geobacteraceae bacterium]|nr:hypothetical protein [Geobacteraceae bacterium]